MLVTCFGLFVYLYGWVCWKFEEDDCLHGSTSNLFSKWFVVGINICQGMYSLFGLVSTGMI